MFNLFKNKKEVYLDNAATTPVDPRVIKVMTPYFNKKFGNSASVHTRGREARLALEEARETVAKSLGAQSSEIIFTSSATESNNTALKGIAWSYESKGKHILISPIEHSCVMNSAEWLQSQGFEVEKLSVDKNGFIDPQEVETKIRPETILVSVMHANNEMGACQPIKEIGAICKEKEVLFHSDAVQSFGKKPLKVNELNVDLLSISAHKIYGPKGVGALFIRDGVKITPLLHGGGHENNKRSATVNVAGIVGLAKATELCLEETPDEAVRQRKLSKKLRKGVLKNISGAHLNGPEKKRLCNNTNISFDDVEGEAIVMMLDDYNIYVSSGSACSAEDLKPSEIITAMGYSASRAHGSVRFTVGRFTKEKDIDYVLEVLPKVINKLRKISPNKRSCF